MMIFKTRLKRKANNNDKCFNYRKLYYIKNFYIIPSIKTKKTGHVQQSIKTK